jgi:hypothetical protein
MSPAENPMRASRLFALAVFVAAGGGVLSAQEKIDNPAYTYWAKYKVGASATLKTTTSSAMFSSEGTMTMKLVEVTAEKIVLEITAKSKVGGMEIDIPPMKQEHLKTVELPKGVTKEVFTSGKPAGTTKEGTETLKVGGQEVKTKWYEYEVKAGGADVKSKMWTSDDVPGMLVKTESKIGGPMPTDSKMELIEFKKP